MAQRGRHSAAHADGGSGSSGAASGASRGGGGGGGVPADRAAGGSGGDGGSGGGGSLRGGGGGGCFPPGGAPAQIRTRPGMPCGTCDGEVWQPTCIEGLAPGVKGNQCGQGGSAGAAAGSLLCGTHERSSPAGPSSAGDTGSAPAQISQQTRPVRSVLGGSRSGNEVGRGGSSSMGSRGFAQQEDDPGGGGGFMPEDLPTRSSFLPELPGSGCSGDLVPTETPGSAFDSGRAAGGGFMPEDLPARGGSRDGNGGLVVLDDMPNSNLSGGSSSGFVPEGLPGGGSGVDGSKYGGGFVPEESPGSGAGAGGADGGGFMPAGLPGGGGACGGTSDGLGGGGFLSGCEQCGCPSISSVWWSTFGARLCDGCARSAPLISKGSAKAAYLLTDRDLRGLGAMPKTNPQHKAWKPMLLYLQSQVEAVAQRKHGSVDELETLRHTRREAKVQQRMQRRSGAGDDGETRGRPDGSRVGGTGGGAGGGAGAAGKAGGVEERIRSRLENEYHAQARAANTAAAVSIAPRRSRVPGSGTCASAGADDSLDVEEI